MNGVSKITVTEDIALVTYNRIPDDLKLLDSIFSKFAQEKINIDMISQTAPNGDTISLSFTVQEESLIEVLRFTKEAGTSAHTVKPMVSSGNCKIRLYGEEMRDMYGVASAAIGAVAKSGKELVLITTSETDMSLLVHKADADEVVKELSKAFKLS